MTDRSLFPEGLNVHQRHLENESAQRAADASRVFTLGSETGVVSGLAVTVNVGVNTKIDVAAGTAYSPAGSFMTLAAGQTGLSLASSTLGDVNYVLLVYDELQSDQEAHTADGTLRYTKATNNPRVVIVTAATYASMAATDTVLANNAKDRATILATVTATGGALSAANISSPPSYAPVLSASVQATLTGVTPLHVGEGTPTGNGTLVWTVGSNTLTWTAPGDTAGAPQTITTSQSYLLPSGTTSKTLLVDVAFSILPTSTTTAAVTVIDLYAHTATRLSLKDVQHRSLTGAGIPSSNNPHGMTLDDLSPGAAGTLEEHQDVMHTDGIGRGSSNDLLKVQVVTGVGTDTMNVTPFFTGDSVYVNGRRITGVVGPTTISAPSTSAMTTEQVYISQDGTLGRRTLATFGTLSLIGLVEILDVVGNSSNTCRIQFTTTGQVAFDPGDGSFGPFKAAPTVDGMLRVYGHNQGQYADLWVKSGLLPGSTITEAVTVTQPLVSDAILVVANVPWSGSASGFLGYGFGISPGNDPNGTYDKRIRGTLDITDVSDRSGMGRDAARAQAYMSDGLVIDVNLPAGTTNNQLTFANAFAYQHAYVVTGLSYSYNGGKAVIGGQLLDIPAKAGTLTDNATNRLYVDYTGTVSVSTSSWDAIASSQVGRPYLRLCEVVEVTGTPTTTDRRVFTGYRRDQPTGVVGLNVNGGAVIAPVAGQGLNVVGTAGNHAIEGDGNATGSGAGVAGISSAASGYGMYAENTAGTGLKGVSSGTGHSAIEALAIGAGVNGVTVNTSTSSRGIDITTGGSGSVGAYITSGAIGVIVSATTTGINVSSSGSTALSVSNAVAPNSTSVMSVAGNSTIAGTTAINVTNTGNGVLVDALGASAWAFKSTKGSFLQADTGSDYKYGFTKTGSASLIASDFVPVNDATFTMQNNGSSAGPYFWRSQGVPFYINAHPKIPVGATITEMGILVENTSGSALTGSVVSSAITKLSYTASPTNAQPYTGYGTGVGITDSNTPLATIRWSTFALSMTVATDDLIVVSVFIANNLINVVRFHGVRIKYTYSTVSSEQS